MAEDQYTKRLLSADSHVMEPANFWVEHVDKKFKDQAPRVVAKPDGQDLVFTGPGLSPFPVAGGFGTGRSGEELKEHMKRGYEAARPSGWDPAERIKDQDIDGVEAEVLYTTLGMPLFNLRDADLQRACFSAYNDWLAEFCAYNPKRLVGTALISLDCVRERRARRDHTVRSFHAGVLHTHRARHSAAPLPDEAKGGLGYG